MADSVMPAALAEIAASLGEVGPAYKGYVDLEQAGVEIAASLPVVMQQKAFFGERQRLLLFVQGAIRELMTHGHPELPTTVVEPEVYADIEENVAAQQTAFSFLRPKLGSATGVGVELVGIEDATD